MRRILWTATAASLMSFVLAACEPTKKAPPPPPTPKTAAAATAN